MKSRCVFDNDSINFPQLLSRGIGCTKNISDVKNIKMFLQKFQQYNKQEQTRHSVCIWVYDSTSTTDPKKQFALKLQSKYFIGL